MSRLTEKEQSSTISQPLLYTFDNPSMVELIEMLILAVAQGIGEFLPISSSGHNAVLVHLFDRFGEPLADDSSEFVKLNILLHVGSLVAVLIIFRQRIIDMFTKDLRLIPLLIIATIPAVVVGYPIHKFFPWLEEYLPLISVCFIATGCLLLYSRQLEKKDSREHNVMERPVFAGQSSGLRSRIMRVASVFEFTLYRKGYRGFVDNAKGSLDFIDNVAPLQSPPTEQGKTTATMTWIDALIIGCSQALAVMPGLSRSGTTIVTGLFCKLKREEAAAFSFLMSIPIIAGGGLLEGFHMIKDVKITYKIEQRAVEFYDAHGFKKEKTEAYQEFLQELSGKKSDKLTNWREEEKGKKIETRIRSTAEQLLAGKTIDDLHVSTIPGWLLLVGALASCVAGIVALVFLLNWLKKGKLWYFAIWVFVMSPLTMVLYLTSPSAPQQTPPVIHVDEKLDITKYVIH